MPAGRPMKFKSPLDLQTKIDAYFADCDPHPEEVTFYQFKQIAEEYTDSKGETKTRMVDDRSQPPDKKTEWRMTHAKPYTITGLAIALGTTRRTLLDYEEDGDYSHTIKNAKSRIEDYVESTLYGSNVTGSIFNLKNNYGWKDKTEVEGSGEQKLIIETRKYGNDNDQLTS